MQLSLATEMYTLRAELFALFTQAFGDFLKALYEKMLSPTVKCKMSVSKGLDSIELFDNNSMARVALRQIILTVCSYGISNTVTFQTFPGMCFCRNPPQFQSLSVLHMLHAPKWQTPCCLISYASTCRSDSGQWNFAVL